MKGIQWKVTEIREVNGSNREDNVDNVRELNGR